MLMLSWKAPSFDAPSRRSNAHLVATTPLESQPSAHRKGNAAGYDAVRAQAAQGHVSHVHRAARPRQTPVSLASSSAIMVLISCPLAMAWPCPRWVEVIKSSGRSAAMAPIPTGLLASVEMHRAVYFAEGILLKRRLLEKAREVHLAKQIDETFWWEIRLRFGWWHNESGW